ncbi:molybdate ABC transporter substrate-binding protein [Clostridium sardiniense]|uniref:molybdate ABC transporter substrate-binding protein n=1 Tax=Clostridium sardiniense TaxID=29369 RepID=UPI003D33A54C
MRKKVIAGFLIGAMTLSLVLVGCGSKKESENKEITVSIAASLQKPMDKIKDEFQKESGIKVNYNSGGSGTLKKQITEGANVDIFFSANTKYANELVDEGLVKKDETYNFLRNSLVLIGNKDNEKKIDNLDELKNVKGKIGVGEVSTVPAGQYTKQTLDNLKLWDSLKDKFIYAKSVTNVVNYVESGDVDYGFVYKTDAMNLKDSKIVYEIPNDYHKMIEYSLCLLKDSKNIDESKKFIDFLKGDKAKEIFKEYGFGVE